MFGLSGVLPRVLPFTQFYPGFTQLPRVKLGKIVQRFYPPTLPAAISMLFRMGSLALLKSMFRIVVLYRKYG